MQRFRCRRALLSNRGATAVEYMVALILIAIMMIGVVKIFGNTISNRYESAKHNLVKMDSEKGYQGKSPSRNSSNSSGSNANGKDAVASKGKGGGKRLSKDDPAYKDETQHLEMLEKAKKSKKAGINPIIILIILFGGGLLCFVIFKGNKQG